MPTLGPYQSLPMTADNGLGNYFKGTYFLSWGISVSFRRAVNRFIKKGFTSYCSPLEAEQLMLPRFDRNSRYPSLDPLARILVSGLSFLFPLCWWCFYGFFFFCQLVP